LKFANRPAGGSKFVDQGDVVLLKIKGKIPEGYRPADRLIDDSLLTAGRKVRITGYGKSVASQDSSAGVLRYTDLVIHSLHGNTEVLLRQTKEGATCSGDSGGPMFIEIDGKWLAAGIASRVTSCLSGHAIYSKMPYYSLGIDEALLEWAGDEKEKQKILPGS
jgi:hypothetical protein